MRAGFAIGTHGLILGVFVTSCGYGFVRSDRPFGAATVAVVPFDEDVPLGMSPDLATALVRHLAEDGVEFTTDLDRAAATLRGRIKSVRTDISPSTAGTGSTIPGYRITIGIDAELVDAAGAKLWSTTLSLSEDFLAANITETNDPVDPTIVLTESSLVNESHRRRAVRRLAQRVARVLHERMVVAGTVTREGGAS